LLPSWPPHLQDEFEEEEEEEDLEREGILGRKLAFIENLGLI